MIIYPLLPVRLKGWDTAFSNLLFVGIRSLCYFVTVHLRQVLEYGSCLWDTRYIEDFRRLERLQRHWTNQVDALQNLSYGGRLRELPLSRTWLKSEWSTFKCNICSNFTNRTWRSWPNHSQGSCEWFDCDLEVLWVELEQIGIVLESQLFGFRPCSALFWTGTGALLGQRETCTSRSYTLLKDFPWKKLHSFWDNVPSAYFSYY